MVWAWSTITSSIFAFLSPHRRMKQGIRWPPSKVNAGKTLLHMHLSYHPSLPPFLPLSLPSPLPLSLPLYAVDPAVITGQPVSLTLVVPGQPATFTVSATGDSLMYQWQKDTVNIATGANSASYMIAAVAESDEGAYLCVVSNTANSVPSTAASLTVCKYAWYSHDFNPAWTREKILVDKFHFFYHSYIHVHVY